MRRLAASLGALAAVALLMAGCGEDGEGTSVPDETVEITAPELSDEGPRLSETEWRKDVEAACESAAAANAAALEPIAEEAREDPDAVDEAEITRRALEASLPIVLGLYDELAEIRPPARLDPGYQEFLADLAEGLALARDLSVALSEDSGSTVTGLQAQIQANATRLTRFADENGVEACVSGA